MTIDLGVSENASQPPVRHFRVAQGTQVAVDDKVYSGGEKFSVEPEHYADADSWVRHGFAEELKKASKARSRGAK